MPRRFAPERGSPAPAARQSGGRRRPQGFSGVMTSRRRSVADHRTCARVPACRRARRSRRLRRPRRGGDVGGDVLAAGDGGDVVGDVLGIRAGQQARRACCPAPRARPATIAFSTRLCGGRSTSRFGPTAPTELRRRPACGRSRSCSPKISRPCASAAVRSTPPTLSRSALSALPIRSSSGQAEPDADEDDREHAGPEQPAAPRERLRCPCARPAPAGEGERPRQRGPRATKAANERCEGDHRRGTLHRGHAGRHRERITRRRGSAPARPAQRT